jgi:predicted DNA-binding transcriptional regulator YafY
MPPDGTAAITKTQRWLDLIVFLVQRRFPVSVDEIMEGVPAYRPKWESEKESDRAAVRRMFERDKDELRAAGIPIGTLKYSIEHGAEEAIGYRLAQQAFYLPYLRLVTGARAAAPEARPAGALPTTLELDPSDLETAADALQRVAAIPGSPFAREARSALRKLSFDLDMDAVAGSPVLFLDPAGAGGVRDVLALLTDAVHRRKRVRFRYHGIARGQPTDRDVAPRGLLYQHGHWYLVGQDATREAMRVFRLGRMADVALADASTVPDFEPDPGFRIADYTGRAPWELGDDDPLQAVVRFDFPLSLWAERNGHGRLQEELPGGAALRTFDVRQVHPFLRWLQAQAGDAIVTDPPELRRAQVDLARATMEACGRG